MGKEKEEEGEREKERGKAAEERTRGGWRRRGGMRWGRG